MHREPTCQNLQLRSECAATTTEALRVIEGKWKIIIVLQLFAAGEPLRLSALQRVIDGVNQKMLIQQLKQLEADGIVERTVFAEVPPRVEYQLTALGIALGPSMEALIEWAHLRRRTRGASASLRDF